jgi:hypothetical protein
MAFDLLTAAADLLGGRSNRPAKSFERRAGDHGPAAVWFTGPMVSRLKIGLPAVGSESS